MKMILLAFITFVGTLHVTSGGSMFRYFHIAAFFMYIFGELEMSNYILLILDFSIEFLCNS